MPSRPWCILALVSLIIQLTVLVAVLVAARGGVLPEVDLAARVAWQAHRPALGSRRGVRGRRRRERHGKKAAAAGQEALVLPCEQCEQVTGVEHGADGADGPTGSALADPARWGLGREQCAELPGMLLAFWRSFATCFRTTTRDASHYAYHYLSALLRMDTERNFTAIGRATGAGGENIQHFMSNSPWSSQTAIKRLQAEVKATPGLGQGAVLLLDESGDEKDGDDSVGAARQYNGRLGKVDMSQVGVCLGYANVVDPERPLWIWVDGRLYLPEHWFAAEMTEHRQKVGLPEDLVFKTKIQLGGEMIEQAFDAGLPFDAVVFDALYGRSGWLRDQVNRRGGIYMADVPCSTLVYLDRPELGVPQHEPGAAGRPPTRVQVLNGAEPVPVHTVADDPATDWQTVRVRPTERGQIEDPFAARRVWTLRADSSEPVTEWLVIRRESDGTCSYSLSNAPEDTPLARLAWLKCQRYFVERTIQEAKSAVGWNDLRARKYRAWQHHLALVMLAVWFLARTRWQWASRFARDARLATQLGLDHLPPLSLANIRLLLQAIMPIPAISPEDAPAAVARLLLNRARSRRSRLNKMTRAHHALAPP